MGLIIFIAIVTVIFVLAILFAKPVNEYHKEQTDNSERVREEMDCFCDTPEKRENCGFWMAKWCNGERLKI